MTLESFGRLLSLCLVTVMLMNVYDKTEMLNCFKEHFVSSGRLFDSVSSVSVQPCVDEPVSSVSVQPCVDEPVRAGQTFSHSQCRWYIKP